MRAGRVVVVMAVWALLLPASAMAGTFTGNTPNFTYTTADPQIEKLRFDDQFGLNKFYVFLEAGSTGAISGGGPPGPGCTDFPGGVSCPGNTNIVLTLNLGQGDDAIRSPSFEAGTGLRYVADGGPGSDNLRGNGGSDQLTGGSDGDVLIGLGGADVINAQDGEVDTIDCGFGTDSAAVDIADVVANCESIDYADADGDGHKPPADCNDGNAAIHPGATDIRGNGIDEDCDGADAKLPVGGRVVAKFDVHRAFTRVEKLLVKALPAGAKVQVTCRGGGCPPGLVTVKARSGTARLTGIFRGRKLKVGAVIKLRVTCPDRIGRLIRYRIRKGQPPKRTQTSL